MSRGTPPASAANGLAGFIREVSMQILLSNACAAHQYINQGIAYFERNEFAKAVALFDIALQLSPDDPYAHWNRATALLSLGEYQRGFK
ncbi:MAG TPA: tetratricopeptide repeat protein, partial [Xanthomonadaceae bacterium]|nr:tetratricopeptide repeat protein [Xanthomonadaceae bacterium]